MKKSKKIFSATLASAVILLPFNQNATSRQALAYDYNNAKIGDKINTELQQQTVIINKDNYIITEYIANNTKVYNVIVKNNDNLSLDDQKKYLELAKQDIDSLPKERALPLIAVITIAGTILGLSLQVDSVYFKPDRDEANKAINYQNGWIDIYRNYKKMWFYKENGKFKTGWHWDNYYKGWYYFYPIKFEFWYGSKPAALMYNPAYEKSRWLKINNKWYEFENGGKLIQHSGWRKYNNKWLYHIPGDYGAAASQSLYINNKWYNFDSNGYWI